MKTTVDIPDNELEDAIRFTKAKTKREAIVGAVAELTRHSGTCSGLITPEELQADRRRGELLASVD